MNTKTHPNDVHYATHTCTMLRYTTVLRYICYTTLVLYLLPHDYNNPMNTATSWTYEFRLERLVIMLRVYGIHNIL